MACLTADIYLGPGSVVSIGFVIVSFFQIGRVTVGAHGIPVLRLIGPEQPVVVVHHLIFICGIGHVVPAAVLCVPGYRKGLQSAAGEFYKVILQRIPSEHIFDLVVMHLAVFTVCVYHKLFAFAEHAVLYLVL